MKGIEKDACRHEFVATDDGEECEVCGVKAIDAKKLAARQLEKSGLTLEDHLLVLLYLLPEHMSAADTKIMKELFLVEREGPRLLSSIPRAGFVPHRFGPCSRNVYEAIDNLQKKGEILRAKDSISKSKEITLSEKGMSRATALLRRFESDKIEALRSYLLKLETLDQRALLRYVYTKYPTYTSKSEIKRKILKNGGTNCA